MIGDKSDEGQYASLRIEMGNPGVNSRGSSVTLKQYYLGCLSHASYLVGDEKTGTAVVVDPQRDVDQYLEDAR